MRPKFEPDVAGGASARPSATLIDPEAYDASEQQFTASLEQRPQPRFVVEEQTQEDERRGDASAEYRSSIEAGSASRILPDQQETRDLIPAPHPGTIAEPAEKPTMSLPPNALQEEQNPENWRREVATRLNNYRARRRPRAPHYPSLRLKFEADALAGTTDVTIESPGTAVAVRRSAAAESGPNTHPSFKPTASTEAIAKIIEFPRSSASPVRTDDLADPVLDRPRILEALEIVPPPPALGGILIEPAEELPCEKRPGFEIPLQSAPMSQRIAAVVIDGILVLSAVALFAYIFSRITKQLPPLQSAAGMALVLMGLFWIAFQYLLLVYCGMTPGLKVAGLRLCRFDGETASRRVRLWRVLASVLSGVSLGLGYAWCFLDEDQLCWHDRITHTYMAPKG
jgi:uncharacterized RDD family membrane protein YckC